MGMESRYSQSDKLVKDVVTQVVLRNTIMEQRQESFVDNKSHEHIKRELFIFKIAQHAGRNIVHSLTVADLRKNKGDCL